MAENGKIVSPGLVLRDLPSKDNNSLLSILTATDGLVTATAYGARKSGSSLSAGTRLFNYSEFTLLESRGRYKVDSAKSLEQFFGLSGSVEGLAAASYFMELLYDVSLAGEADVSSLRLALNALYALSQGKKPHRLVKAAFELRLMALAGFEPALDACFGCGSETVEYFDVAEAGVLCASCASPRRAAGQRVYPLYPAALDAMRYIVFSPMPRLFSFALGEEAAANLSFLCELYTREQMGRSYDSLDIYHALCDGQGE